MAGTLTTNGALESICRYGVIPVLIPDVYLNRLTLHITTARGSS